MMNLQSSTTTVTIPCHLRPVYKVNLGVARYKNHGRNRMIYLVGVTAWALPSSLYRLSKKTTD